MLNRSYRKAANAAVDTDVQRVSVETDDLLIHVGYLQARPAPNITRVAYQAGRQMRVVDIYDQRITNMQVLL